MSKAERRMRRQADRIGPHLELLEERTLLDAGPPLASFLLAPVADHSLLELEFV